jgi:site-specific DNA recombinase
MQGNQTEKYTLLYGRLSNEDKREGTSLSIQHQEEMLRAYAEKHGFRNPLFLYDDGVSGTKTNRPGFQKVLAMIRDGQAATLIVTDLTRLYRNQSEANNLLEIVFPALGVRFIAITNNYDSATNTESDEDLAMFSNLFNEWYPRQTSRKINAVIQHKAEKGVRIASIPPYGYQKDPADKFKIIPDPEAAEKVRYIFRLCASGMGTEQIAKRLERERVLVPTEYAYRKFGRNHSSRNPDFPYRWPNSTVARILENTDYIGVQVSCKTHKPSYKSDLVVEVPEEERYRVENAHEPIIDRELWDIVQRVRTNKRRPTKLGEMDMLAGMVQCADCGSTHYLCRCGSWDESKYTYVCGKYHRHKEECTPHTVKGPAPAGSCFTSDTDRRTNGTSRPGSLHRPFDSQTIRPVEKGTDSQAEGTGAVKETACRG